MAVPNIGVIAGTPNTGLENADALIRHVDSELYFLDVDKHPIVSSILTNGMTVGYRENSSLPKITGKPISKQAVQNQKFEFFEDQVELSVAGYSPTVAVTASATSLTVSSTDDDHFRAGDVLLLTNANGQTERTVIASVSSLTLNVENSDGTTRTAGITMTTGDKFYLLENVRQEDSTAPAIRTTKRGSMYNYTEIISEPYGLTKGQRATADYNGDPWMREKRKAWSRFLRKMEKSFFFGERALATSTTNPRYSSGGFFYFAELYSDVEIRDMQGSALTRAELDSFLLSVGQFGSPNKVLVCGKRGLAALNAFGYENVRVQNYQVGEFGMNIKKVFGPMGELQVVYEPLFDEVRTFAGHMVVLDMTHIKYSYLSKNGLNLDVHDEPQLLADGSTAEKGQYIGYCGWQFSTLRSMGIMKNVGA